MKKIMKTWLAVLSLVAFWALMISQSSAANESATADVYVWVTWGTVTIGTTWATLELGTGANWTTVSGVFPNDSFRLKDLKWSTSGYRTTIQVSALSWALNNGQDTIPAENVSFQYSSATVDKLEWADNTEVLINSGLASPLTWTVNYIIRNKNTTANLLWKYWATLKVNVLIPDYAPATRYHGVITYTLFDEWME